MIWLRLSCLLGCVSLMVACGSNDDAADVDVGEEDVRSAEGSSALRDLPLGAPEAAPDVRIGALDALGVRYEVTRRRIGNDEPDNKSVLEVTLPGLDEGGVNAVRQAFGNVSGVRYQPSTTYHLEDFLWPVAQAALNKNIVSQVVELEGINAQIALQTNCWSTVYEVLRGDSATFNVFQNSVEHLVGFFRSERYSQPAPSWSKPQTFPTAAKLREQIKTLSFGDVVIASSCFSEEDCGPIHAAVVVDDDLLFERTGGASDTDVYRLVTASEFNDLWYDAETTFEARRFDVTNALPDPRWTLEFRQGEEGYYTYLAVKSVPYAVDAATNLRSFDAKSFRGLLRLPTAPPFSDLVVAHNADGFAFEAPADELQEIWWTKESSVMTSCEQGKFCPSADLGRGELDVALAALAKRRGLPAPRFRAGGEPKAKLSRAEMMSLLRKYVDEIQAAGHAKGLSPDPRLVTAFRDVAAHAAKADIEAMSGLCSIASREDDEGNFAPERPASRAHAARALYRLDGCLEEARR